MTESIPTKTTRKGCLYKLLERILLACLLLLLALSAAITYIVRQRPQTIQAPCASVIGAGSLEQFYGSPSEHSVLAIRMNEKDFIGNVLFANEDLYFVPSLELMLKLNLELPIAWWLRGTENFDSFVLYPGALAYRDGFALHNPVGAKQLVPIDWHIPPFANDDTVRLALPSTNSLPGLLLSMPPDSNRLDMALHIDAEWSSRSGVPILLPPQGQHPAYLAVACPTGASLNNLLPAFAGAMRWLLPGCELDSVLWLRHPAVQALLSQPTPVVAVFAHPAAPGAKAQLTLLFPEKREAWVMETLRTAQMDAALIPETLGMWNGVVLPPSATTGAPLVGWLADCVAIAGTPQAFEALPAPPHFAPQPAPAAIGFAAEGHLDTYNGVPLPKSPELIPGDWLIFTANSSIEAAVANLIRPAELCEPSPENNIPEKPEPFWDAGTSYKPYNAHYQIQSLLAADKLYDALDLWQRHAPSPLGDEPGAVYAPGFWPHRVANPMPLVTETAWCILNSCALYTVPEGSERVKEWGDFLVDWKRGPDAAPLSTIEESASQDDLYPLVTVWLGLRTATSWMYPEGDNVPARWTHRIEELQTEISARLLRPGQCLTRRDYLMPPLRNTPGLSSAALDAIARLPECPISETRFLEPPALDYRSQQLLSPPPPHSHR